MEIYSDCPQCDHQNQGDIDFVTDSFRQVSLTCEKCGCEYLSRGWVVYEEDDTKIIKKGEDVDE